MPEPTSIQVSTELWQALNRRKRPGDTFEDVIWRELNEEQPDEQEPDDPLEELEFPGGRDRDECLAAIEAAARYLEKEGSASMREIVADVMPEHPIGYDVPELEDGGRYRGAWWRRVVKPGLKALDGPEKPSGGRREWRWTGS